MTREITVASVQMDGAVAPLEVRLKRAADLIGRAAAAGAQLVALPDIVNTGYTYDERLAERTERLDGPTLRWIREQAAEHNVHVVGSWLVAETNEVFNAAFLVAPDGQQWRYDKQWPFLWERAYFREGDRVQVADTALGKIGLLINWDAAHAHLWEAYAAHVDLMIVLSSMPRVAQSRLRFPDDVLVPVEGLGRVSSWTARTFTAYLDEDLAAQARWMRTPIIVSGASGLFSTHLPAPELSFLALTAFRPDLWSAVRTHGGDLLLEAPFASVARIVDASGATVARPQERDDLAIATLSLPDRHPVPQDAQPILSVPSVAYPAVDALATPLFVLNYRRILRRQWGMRMAPGTPRNRYAWVALLIVALLVFLIGRNNRD